VSRRSILLVEDDRDIREILAASLEDEGFEVMTASNGLEALRVLRTRPTPPDVILLDLMMPVLDGYGFLAERRKDPALASIPVAIVTASQGVDRRQVDTDTAIISKPIDLQRLVTMLDELGARSGPSA
jgi:CheY-like chemotaxis protein